MKRISAVLSGTVLVLCLPLAAFAGGSTVVEEIIARVNNDIITLSDYEKAATALRQEAQQDCQNCSETKIDQMVNSERKNLLRDLIDHSLLVQRAKDMSINVDTDVIKELDQVRQQNHLPSMEALQKAVEAQGMAWEDYKEQLKNQLLTQRVIQQEVGPTVKIGHEEAQKYYDAHKDQFVKPEEVDLSTIYFSTENKTPEQKTAIEKKADGILQRLKAGEEFSTLAKRFSEGPTAAQGGELGEFKRGELDPALEKMVFALKKGEFTGVIPAPNGLQIVGVNNHFDAGLQPLSKVESDVENAIYQEKIQPALRKYLAQLRKDSYVVVKAGYEDTGGASTGNVIQEVPYSADQGKSKKKKPAEDNPDQ